MPILEFVRGRACSAWRVMPHRVSMVRMSSSSIAAAGYDHRRHALRLRYVSGVMYDYLDVPVSVFEELLEAPSKGRFVNWYIKPRYRFTRLN